MRSKNLKNLSLNDLIRKIENAPDFGYDDEEEELYRRGKEQGFTCRWSDDILNPKIIIIRNEE